MRNVPGTTSAYAERVIGGYYLDIVPDRDALARYGLMIGNLQDTIAMALGGEAVTTTVEGRERYTVNVRYPRDLRDDPQAIARDVLVPLPGGGAVPLGEVAKVQQDAGAKHHPHRERPARGLYLCRHAGPRYRRLCRRRAKSGGGQCQVSDRHLRAVERPVRISCERAIAKLKIVVPLTLLIIFLLLYLNFGTLTETLIVMLSLPFALVGGLWLMWWLGFNMSVAVAVGFIALAGVAAETGVVMLIYLDQALKEVKAEREAEGEPFTRADLNHAIMLGAVERVRPKMMTVVAIMAGLLPILWSTGTGSEVMQRIAVPMIGGMVSSTMLTLIVIPAIYALVKGARLPKASKPSEPRAAPWLVLTKA